MLVLSRRAEQQVVFPHLGIRISVLQVKGQLVKLGVDAPQEVRILRSELVDESDSLPRVAGDKRSCSASEHALRNELNLLHLKIQALQYRVDRGDQVDAEQALQTLLNEFSAIDHTFDTAGNSPPNRAMGRPLRLLVVEDSDNERQLMAYVLAAHGFDVQVAPDGLTALSQLELNSQLPDCVLMDMQMPYANGLETLCQIRSSEELKHLLVFAVTGSKRDVSSEPIAHSWDGWFAKPLDVKALVNRLERVVDHGPQPQTV